MLLGLPYFLLALLISKTLSAALEAFF